jgi:hypothetical protein
VSKRSDGEGAAREWRVVPWDMQNYVYYYLRSRQFPITIRNTRLIAHVLARRLAAGPVVHRDLDVVIENSAVEHLLDDDE